MAKIPLDFEHERRWPPLWIVCLPAEYLLGEGVHTSRSFAAAHRSKNGNAGVQTRRSGMVSHSGLKISLGSTG